MLAAWLAILLTMEVAVLITLGVHWIGAGHSVSVVVGVCAALAFLWRAGLVAFTMATARVDRGLGKGGAGKRLVVWTALWMRETVAMATAYLAMTIEPLRQPRGARLAEGSGPLVVMVHGWLCNGAVWRPVVRRLRRTGWRDVHCITLSPVLGNIDDMAQHLGRLIAALQAGGQPRRLVLVTHSMGGLVARAWLRRLDRAARETTTLVTIGCPHRGTRLATLGPGVAARQMRLGSAWLGELQASPGPAPALTCIGSPTDNFIAPQEGAWLPGVPGFAVAGVGHFGLLRAAATAEHVIAAYGSPPLAAVR